MAAYDVAKELKGFNLALNILDQTVQGLERKVKVKNKHSEEIECEAPTVKQSSKVVSTKHPKSSVLVKKSKTVPAKNSTVRHASENNCRTSHHRVKKYTEPVRSRNFAQPTLSALYRQKLTVARPTNQENFLKFMPTVRPGNSHCIGTLVKQNLARQQPKCRSAEKIHEETATTKLKEALRNAENEAKYIRSRLNRRQKHLSENIS